MPRYRFTRRSFLRSAGLAASGLAAPALVRQALGQSMAWPSGSPFSLGVASGAPTPDGFILWTRLAPDPLSTDPATPGGMIGSSVQLAYEIATDDGMRDVIRRGVAQADASLGYSVHVDIAGLESDRPYWYRFLSGSAASRIGRARTLPAPGSSPDRLRFGFVSCSNYEHGYFSAYRHLIEENPDVVVFLGDYAQRIIHAACAGRGDGKSVAGLALIRRARRVRLRYNA